ncbi:MAG: hypothetical protein KF864_02770 [Phycisphaeraceae bacterium]|nr:hypothetical protein [Phycisphaeraceae bacterium]
MIQTNRRRSKPAPNLTEQINSPAPRLRLWLRPLLTLGRMASWAVLTPPRAGLRKWSAMSPLRQLVLGFVGYCLLGTLLLCLPFAQKVHTPAIDNAFSAVSAVSTTGLTTVDVGSSYSWFGQGVILALFQGGGIGFMTLSSILIVARGKTLSTSQMGVLKAGFSVPHYFVMQHFIVHAVIFTFVCEAIGAGLLWWRFSVLGVESPLWSAIFHAVSAFATAGFSLNKTSMEAFSGDWVVNVTIGTLAYLGAVGFIVAQDVWYTIKLRERMLTFTSKVILAFTGAVFLVGSLMIFFLEPAVQALPHGERALASAFQVMTASTTAGFNTVPVGQMSSLGLIVLMTVMIIGASPSGTGGGIKTTGVSAILGNLLSVLKRRDRVVWFGHEIPLVRVHYAFAAATVYLVGLLVGLIGLVITDSHEFLPLVFEAASAIGTAGLSMGITGELSAPGKVVIMTLMFAGRCGPLTIGLSLLRPDTDPIVARKDDLAV